MPFQKKSSTMGEQLVAVFSGRQGLPAEMSLEVFGWLMMKLKLWEQLKTPEDVALHNVALDILKEMRASPSLGLRHPEKIIFSIEYERPEV